MSHCPETEERSHAGFARGAGHVGAANYAGAAASVLRGFLLARILGPAGLGLFNAAILSATLAQNADLGAVAAMGRDLPGLLRTDAQRAHSVAGLALMLKLAVSAVLAPIVAYSVFGAQTKGFHLDALGVCLVAGVIFVLGPWQWSLSWLTAGQKFTLLSRFYPAYALLMLVSCGVGAVAWGLDGALGAFILVTLGLLAVSASIAVKEGVFVSWQRMGSRSVSLVRAGFSMMVLAVLGYVLVNVDQVVVGWFFGPADLGLYGIGLMFGQLVTMMPASLSTVVGPRILESHHLDGSLDLLRDSVWLPVRFISLGLVVPLAVAIALLPRALPVVLPAYTGAVVPAQLYGIAVYFLLLNSGVSSLLFALHRHTANIPIMMGCITLNVVFDVAALSVVHSLWVVALGSVITYLAYYVLHIGYGRLQFDGSRLAVGSFLIKTAAPALLLLSVFGLSFLDGNWGLVVSMSMVLGYTFAIRNRIRGLLTVMRGPGK